MAARIWMAMVLTLAAGWASSPVAARADADEAAGFGAKPVSPAGPHLQAAWRLTDAEGEPVKSLTPGGEYRLTVELSSVTGGVKFNPLVKSQTVFIAGAGRRGPIRASGGRIDVKTGRAVLALAVRRDTRADALPEKLTMNVSAVLCDDDEQWCAAVREATALELPAGKAKLKTAELGYHAGDAERVILKPGDQAPDFTVVNDRNEKVSLSRYKGKKNVILVFSRAHW